MSSLRERHLAWGTTVGFRGKSLFHWLHSGWFCLFSPFLYSFIIIINLTVCINVLNGVLSSWGCTFQKIITWTCWWSPKVWCGRETLGGRRIVRRTWQRTVFSKTSLRTNRDLFLFGFIESFNLQSYLLYCSLTLAVGELRFMGGSRSSGTSRLVEEYTGHW